MKPFEFDLNEPPPIENEVREAGQPCIHHVPMAPAEQSLQPQVYPSRGTIEVVELDSDDEDEVNHEDEGGDNDDDDGEDADYDEEDDDGDDDDGEEEENDNDDGYSYNVGYNDEDVAAGGDDVIISSSIACGQACSSLRAHGRTSVIDSESLQIADIHQRNVRRRVEPQPRVNICDFTVDLGGTRSSMPNPVAPPTPAPPQLPTYECPICMEPLVEHVMATRWGHMFCERCIRDAVDIQAECPICRRKVVHRELNRIYFPTRN